MICRFVYYLVPLKQYTVLILAGSSYTCTNLL
jgi:hypothetical protein